MIYINLDPDDRRCQSCANGRREEKFPRCRDCMRRSLELGLCKWCGERPRIPKLPRYKQGDYCQECHKAAVLHFILTQEGRPESTSKYRGPDHRERTGDTKFGSNR